jgi:hypothetical protein
MAFTETRLTVPMIYSRTRRHHNDVIDTHALRRDTVVLFEINSAIVAFAGSSRRL